VFVANNLMSIGALKAFHNLGVRLPRDLSFVGFDDLDMAELLSPAPTVIARPMAEQGVLAMRLLMHLLDEEPDRLPQRLVLDTHLIVRDSAGPPPASSKTPGPGGGASDSPERGDSGAPEAVRGPAPARAQELGEQGPADLHGQEGDH
jgi:hypothetical protein